MPPVTAALAVDALFNAVEVEPLGDALAKGEEPRLGTGTLEAARRGLAVQQGALYAHVVQVRKSIAVVVREVHVARKDLLSKGEPRGSQMGAQRGKGEGEGRGGTKIEKISKNEI